MYCVEPWTLRKVDQKYLESFEMWSRRRVEKISGKKKKKKKKKKYCIESRKRGKR